MWVRNLWRARLGPLLWLSQTLAGLESSEVLTGLDVHGGSHGWQWMPTVSREPLWVADGSTFTTPFHHGGLGVPMFLNVIVGFPKTSTPGEVTEAAWAFCMAFFFSTHFGSSVTSAVFYWLQGSQEDWLRFEGRNIEHTVWWEESQRIRALVLKQLLPGREIFSGGVWSPKIYVTMWGKLLHVGLRPHLNMSRIWIYAKKLPLLSFLLQFL